ncbi:MAG: hypothetical protein J6Y18_03935 [Candidatus Methanomethylophilaceae archaeon]|nr:hypothetical protein [Candidatus Methanomethylophilaceae archaeon]
MRPPEEDLKENEDSPERMGLAEGFDAISNITVGFVKRTSEIINSFIDVLVGVAFLVLGIMMIWKTYDLGGSFTEYGLLDWVTLFDMFIGGAILILNPRRTFSSSIGIYAITMGLMSFCNNWADIGSRMIEEDDIFAFLSFIDDIIFIVNLVMVILSINLMVSGIYYIRGRARGTVGMMNRAAFMLFISLFYIFYDIGTGEYPNLIELAADEPEMLIQAFMFFILLLIMDTDEARSYNTKNRLGRSTDAIRYSNTMDKRSFIELEDARALVDPDMSLWISPNDGGPVEKEFRFPIQTQGGASHVTVQRWAGSDKYYLTISDHEQGTNIRATRLTAESFVLSEDYSHIDMRGSDHFIIRIPVRMPLSELQIARRGSE